MIDIKQIRKEINASPNKKNILHVNFYHSYSIPKQINIINSQFFLNFLQND